MRELKIRLFLNQPLGPGQTLPLTGDQAHYLFAVMRLRAGAELAVFNGRDGEWRARVDEAGKRGGTLCALQQTGRQIPPPDLWLLFAPLKKTRTDFVVEKAVELGVARIRPVMTEFTNAERLRPDRLQARAVEAAEQCGATHVPEVDAPEKLTALLAAWPADRRLLFCDEAAAGRGGHTGFGGTPPPAAVLIGPEGGFSKDERRLLNKVPQAVTVTLGPRILRAETASVAALTLWQAENGDW